MKMSVEMISDPAVLKRLEKEKERRDNTVSNCHLNVNGKILEVHIEDKIYEFPMAEVRRLFMEA